MSEEQESVQRVIESIDRESPLVLDREGRFWHDGGLVEHSKLLAALHRWIDRDEKTGRYILRAGSQWCFITVEDAPYQVEKVLSGESAAESPVHIRLSDGTEEELDCGTLRQASNNSLYCDVKEGRFTARFQRSAYYKLAQQVVFVGEEPRLQAGGRQWPIGHEADDEK